jgi:hypothetical protein
MVETRSNLIGYTKRMKRNNTIQLLAVLLLTSLSVSCREVDDALTAHSRPAASVAGVDLGTHALGRIMAQSPIPDSGLNADIAGQVAQLWADYVILASIYAQPDTTHSIDFVPLLEEGRYFANLAVERYRDSVLNQNTDPTEEEIRAYFDTQKPFTRLDLRRIVIPVPAGASEEARDSLYEAASVLRERLAGGADFVEVARERSADPPANRGAVMSFQGHESVPEVADSALFSMRPGEISPVFATNEAMLIYRVEQVRTPEYEQARQLTYDWMVEERSEQSQTRTVDSLLAAAQRAVPEGAAAAALRIASEKGMAESAISGSTPLVMFAGGSLTASELRRLFRVRPELRDGFTLASVAEVENYLLELAADEVIVQAAEQNGFAASESERLELEAAIAAQLASVATKYGISHEFVTNPSFRIDLASQSFLRGVLQAQQPVPWLTEFRYVLDPEYPAVIHERGAETAARLAVDLRESMRQDSAAAPAMNPGDPGDPEEPAESEGADPEHDADSEHVG